MCNKCITGTLEIKIKERERYNSNIVVITAGNNGWVLSNINDR